MPAHRKPIAALQDTRPSRVNDRSLTVVDPAAADGAPPCPKGLLASSQKAWSNFWSSRMATMVDPASDLPGLIRWVIAYDEWLRSTRAVKDVRIVNGSMGQPVLNPLAGYAQQRAAELRDLERQYGMTPKSRLDLGLTGTQVELTVAKINEMARGESARSERSGRDQEDDLATFEGEFSPA